MAQVTDPVCGMNIDSESAAATSVYDGQTYYFCTQECAQRFEAAPERYVGTATGELRGDSVPLERHEPPFTQKGFPAPKFGSAGSGGAEFEPGPERHDK